ncbi:MAG: carboxypeptidase-like regulatory domain-containing protein [Bryobacteraceae bacterium]
MCIALVCAAVSRGQTSFATIQGLVSDPSGAAVPGARIVLVHADTGTRRQVSSGATGLYSAPSLVPGSYQVSVEAQGFRRQLRRDVELRVNETVRLDFWLQVGELIETVEVSAEVPPLNMASSTVSAVVTNDKIVNMPLNGRQFTQLILLLPGVSGRQLGAIGLADKLVLRTGYAVFYNSNFMAGALGRPWPVAPGPGAERQQPERGFPPTPVAGAIPERSIFDRGLQAGRTGYSQQWNFSLQRQFGEHWVIEGAYVGGKGTKLYTLWRANAAPPGPGPVGPRRPFPQFGTISEENPGGASTYHATQWRVERGFRDGFSLLGS